MPKTPQLAILRNRIEIPRWMQICFWISLVIAIAVVMRRLVAFAHPTTGGPPNMAALDGAFASHQALTIAHIVPAAIFVLLVPLVLKHGTVRPLIVAFYVLGAWVGLTAYAMNQYPVGGLLEQSAVWTFNTLFLLELAHSYRLWLRNSLDARRWQIRAVAVLLGIATTRPVMGVFFATSQLTHLAPQQFFGMAFWVGFLINTVGIELWLRRRNAQI